MNDERRRFDLRTTSAERFPIMHYVSKITDTLNEWNEETVFSIDPVIVMPTMQGVSVTGVLWHQTDQFDGGEFTGLSKPVLDGQVLGVYGDDDILCFLGILTNPGIEVLIDQVIRG